MLLLEEDRGELVARAAVGIEEEVEQGVRIPFGKGFAGRVAAERHPVILDDVDHADVLNPILREKGIKSLLGVPCSSATTYRRAARGHARPSPVHGRRHGAPRPRRRPGRARGRTGPIDEQTSALEELRSNFVAIASHELRTPASAVYGTLATLAQRAELSPDTREELIRMGYEQAERLRRVTEQLVDLSQLDARRASVKPELLDVRDRLAEIVRETVPAHISVELQVEPSLSAALDPMVSTGSSPTC